MNIRLVEFTAFLHQLRDEASAIIENDPEEALSTSEVFLAALSNLSIDDIPRIEYTSPIGTVAREGVEFVLGEGFSQPLFPIDYEGEDDE